MKLTFKAMVIVRAAGGKAQSKIEIPRYIWQGHEIMKGDALSVEIHGRTFGSKVKGTESQRIFTIPTELRRELRLHDSEIVEVTIEVAD
ncbi:MAG: hypothetical protein HY367_03950 [Candidatus Aenigmarchaeota archaeon]|nr:hypothetical protein [Candidatus Aenigmarchaeota archaeon]